jgi:hypothetical protein
MPVLLSKLRAWAAQFHDIDSERYSALQFVEWLELETAPPVRSNGDFGSMPVYPVWAPVAMAGG